MIKNVESKSCGSGHWASTKNTQSLMPPHEYAKILYRWSTVLFIDLLTPAVGLELIFSELKNK